MKLLLINPNTTAAMTERMVELAQAMVPLGCTVTGATARFGASYVACRAAYAVAGHAALDAYAQHGHDVDVVLLACFGDPGLGGLKELARQPVVGMAEASCLLAAALGGKFAIVTGGHRWEPMLEEFASSIGLRSRLAGVATVAPTGAEIAAHPDRALALLADACTSVAQRTGASSVILGGAGLAGLAARLADDVPVPLIDSLEAGIGAAIAIANLQTAKVQAAKFAPSPPVETVGLSKSLSEAFDNQA
jgi:allantoin racemase